MLVSSKELLQKARQEGYGICAPDFIDLDTARVYCLTAQKERKPIILSFAQSHSSVISLEEAALIGKYWAEKVDVPIVLHLDHGEDFDFIKKAIDLGFTSVMIDASKDDFETNVRKTKEVVEYAHAMGVPVEAEIGHVGSGLNYENHAHTDSIYTNPQEAVRFVELTGVDSLAVSIGTAHGVYKHGNPEINFEVLNEIRHAVDIPLVLHGGSSTGFDQLKKCALSGISKINIFTDFLVNAMTDLKEHPVEDYFSLKESVNESMAKTLTEYFEVFETKEVE